MKTIRRLLLVLLCVALAIVFWQNTKIDGLQKNLFDLRQTSSEMDQLRAENARLSASGTDSDELARLRKEHSELLRLRGEVSRLRQQLKTQPTTSKSPEPSVAPTNNSPVEIFTANVEADLAPRQTLVTGGWTMTEGKRTFLLLEPNLIDEVGNDMSAEQAKEKGAAAQVNIQARFVEVPDEFLQELGLQDVSSDNSAQLIFNDDQAKLLFKGLTNSAGTDTLSAPRVTTLTGRQAQVSVLQEKTINNETYVLGPAVDVLPTVSSDGKFIKVVIKTSITRETPSK